MDIDKMTLISYNNGIKLCVVRTPVSHTQARVEHARAGHAGGRFEVPVCFGFCAVSGDHRLRI